GLDGVWLTDDDTTAINPVSAYGNRIMFTAREYDNESGLYYYRARMYHPVLGRFMSPEPVIMHLLRVWAAAVYIFVFFCFAVEQLVNSNKFLESTFPFKSLVISFVLNAATLAAAVLIINFMHRLIIRNENN
ncbi:MAG: RHS repeat-associated core domain-containing protein, partial [Phycisphaerae bacterium]